MKRNFDLIRDILLHIESQDSGFFYKPVTLEDYPKEETTYNLVLMIENNLLEGKVTPVSGRSDPLVIISRMTWKGHDFLDASRDSQRWTQAKEVFVKVGGVTFDVAKDVLIQLMTKKVSQVLAGGVPIG
jgi:hypothetical protein